MHIPYKIKTPKHHTTTQHWKIVHNPKLTNKTIKKQIKLKQCSSSLSDAFCCCCGAWLDWVGLDWIGLDLIGLDWVGLDCIGLDWIGLDWIGLGWILVLYLVITAVVEGDVEVFLRSFRDY